MFGVFLFVCLLFILHVLMHERKTTDSESFE